MARFVVQSGIESMSEYPGVSGDMFRIIRDYVMDGMYPGGFVAAVLANNLFAAVARGDAESVSSLRAITLLIYNHCPGECWGCEEDVVVWMRGRISGESNDD